MSPKLIPGLNMKGEPSPSDLLSVSAELLDYLRPKASSPLPNVRQLYLNFYAAIEQGQLPYNTRLPSSRQLSQQLGVARNTVISVYEQLIVEGLLSADGRRGTRVERRIKRTSVKSKIHLHRSVRSTQILSQETSHRELAPGEPDTHLFPESIWRKAQTTVVRQSAANLGYRTQALSVTREAIARFLTNYRSLNVDPEQIVVTSGTRQSLNLAATLFADHGETAWLECPGYLGGVDAFQQSGLKVEPCMVDEKGFVLPKAGFKPPRLIYLTPCFQFPFGMPLAAERRQALLELSRRHGTVLFEDDYDSEFRDNSQPRPSLAGDAAGAIVLNAGTFSKLLFPAIRLGWLVVPANTVDDAYRCLRAIGGGNNTIAQMVVAELLNNGSIARHLRHARQVYGQRRMALIKSLNGCELLKPIDQVSGSLSLVLHLRKSVSIEILEQALAEQRLGAQALERMDWSISTPTRCKAIVVGLGNVDTLSIPETARRFVFALKSASK